MARTNMGKKSRARKYVSCDPKQYEGNARNWLFWKKYFEESKNFIIQPKNLWWAKMFIFKRSKQWKRMKNH